MLNNRLVFIEYVYIYNLMGGVIEVSAAHPLSI